MPGTLSRAVVSLDAFATVAVLLGCSDDSSPAKHVTDAGGAVDQLGRLDFEQRNFTTGGNDRLVVEFGTTCVASSSLRPAAAPIGDALCADLRRVFEPAATIAALRTVPSCGGTSDMTLSVLTNRSSARGEIGACVGATTEPYVTYYRVLTRVRDEVER